MMLVPDNLKYTKDHEWVKFMGSNIYRIGITDYAQDALGDVVFVEIKEIGTPLKAGDAFGEAESTKSVSDLYTPISGRIHSINLELEKDPELVNSDPYGRGWMCEILAEKNEVSETLLSPEEYKGLMDD